MSGAGGGRAPPQLSPHDVQRIADVRRDVWTAGMKGAVGGVVSGYIAFTVNKAVATHPLSGPLLGRDVAKVLLQHTHPKYKWAVCMLGSALLSFGSALREGTHSREVHRLDEVYKRGADPEKQSAYQRRVTENAAAREAEREEAFLRRKEALLRRQREGPEPGRR